MEDRSARRIAREDLLVFALLVAIGIAGRVAQPMWNFTPIAAVGLFAGAYFRRRWVAPLVPLAALAVSNLWLPAYNPAVMISVYAMLALPALAGPLLRRPAAGGTVRWLAGLAIAAAAPSLAFFVVTNFAEWAFTGAYAKTPGGLLECYSAALPFYRQMLVGDLFYAGVLFGSMAAVGADRPVAAGPTRETHTR